MPHPLFPDDEFHVEALTSYPVDDHTGDGYDWIGDLPTGWKAVVSWGSEGWELGSLPYEIVAHYDCPLGVIYGMAHYVEGDVTVTAYGSSEVRDAVTDELALATWLSKEGGPREGLPAKDTPAAEIPARFRGPYCPDGQAERAQAK